MFRFKVRDAHPTRLQKPRQYDKYQRYLDDQPRNDGYRQRLQHKINRVCPHRFVIILYSGTHRVSDSLYIENVGVRVTRSWHWF